MAFHMKQPRNKYGNVKTTIRGEKFDSQREGLRWLELRQMVRDGKIHSLERQVTYVLAPKVKIAGEKRSRPALRFTADFRYVEKGKMVIEDAKGMADTAFRMRQHLMKSVLGIDVRLS